MLAHNATIHRVRYSLGELFDAPFDDPYVVGLEIVVDLVKRTRDDHEREMKARHGG